MHYYSGFGTAYVSFMRRWLLSQECLVMEAVEGLSMVGKNKKKKGKKRIACFPDPSCPGINLFRLVKRSYCRKDTNVDRFSYFYLDLISFLAAVIHVSYHH